MSILFNFVFKIKLNYKMPFWRYQSFQDNSYNLASTGQLLPLGAYGRRAQNELGAKILQKQFIEFKAVHWPRSFIDLRGRSTKTHYKLARRYSAKFGGFFSLRSTSAYSKNVFINGFSFFSIAGARGWSFVTYDNFPWNAESLNRQVFNKFKFLAPEANTQKNVLEPVVINWRPSFSFFDQTCSLPGDLSNEQLNNFSFHYRAQHGAQLFSGRRFRDDEAFKIFCEQTRLFPSVISSAPHKFGGALHSLVCDYSHFMFSYLVRKFFLEPTCFSAAASGSSTSISALNSHFEYTSYDNFALSLNSAAAAVALENTFEARPPFMRLRHHRLAKFTFGAARRFILTPRVFDRQFYLWAFLKELSFKANKNTNRKFSRARLRAALLGPIRQLGLRRRGFVRKYFRSVYGNGVFFKKKWVKYRSLKRLFTRRSRRTSSYTTRFNFLSRFNGLSGHGLQLYNSSQNVFSRLAVLFSKRLRRKFVSRRRHKFFHRDRSATWHKAPRALFGRKNRKRMIMLGR